MQIEEIPIGHLSLVPGEISDEMLQTFTEQHINMSLNRYEPNINLVRPFYDDEIIKINTFNWMIENEKYGELSLCYSHVL